MVVVVVVVLAVVVVLSVVMVVVVVLGENCVDVDVVLDDCVGAVVDSQTEMSQYLYWIEAVM